MSILKLSVTDDDRYLENAETDTTWALNGVVLAGPPALNFATANADIFGSPGFGVAGSTFTIGTDSYFLPGAVSAERITAISSIDVNAVLGATAYVSVQMTPVDAPVRQTQALVVSTLPQFPDNTVQNITV